MRDIEAIVERAAKEARLLMIETVLRGMIVEARDALIELRGKSGVNLLPAIALDVDGMVRFKVKAINAATGYESTSDFSADLDEAAFDAMARLTSERIVG